ncbi:glucokinase [Prevotellaceae bacterium MN60]|nr:glucokinase [Prevotellaceae bacterium MN60]
MNDKVKSRVIGIDIDVNTTTIAVVDLRGNIIAQDSIQTEQYTSINSFVEALSERVIALAEANGGYENIRSVGMCAPSANFLTGCIENAANMPWKGIVPLAAMLRDSIGLAVALGNDAHCSALGESAYGVAHGMETFITITMVRSGLGSCFFSNGVAHLGYDGFAGEVGHACIEDGGRQCTCGRRGCLEEYVSNRGIIRTARELMEKTDTPSILRDAKELTLESILDAANKNDALAIEVWRYTGVLLGIGIANYASIVNPEAIIITGEIIKMVYPKMWDVVEETFKEHVFGNIRDKVKIVLSAVNDHERNVLGASALAWKVKEYSLFK